MRIRALLALAAFALALENPGPASAALSTYTDAAQFVAATGVSSFESFEQLAPRTRTVAPVTVPAFTVTPLTAPLGIQNGPDSPETGYGASATDGTHYLFVYSPGQAFGTLRFDLARPATAFGLYVSDIGEAAGVLSIATNAGEALSGFNAAEFPPILGNGNLMFFGFAQSTPFTQVLLTSTGIDEAYGLDQVYVSAVPVPAAGWLLLSGVLALGGPMVRRRRD